MSYVSMRLPEMTMCLPVQIHPELVEVVGKTVGLSIALADDLESVVGLDHVAVGDASRLHVEPDTILAGGRKAEEQFPRWAPVTHVVVTSQMAFLAASGCR